MSSEGSMQSARLISNSRQLPDNLHDDLAQLRGLPNVLALPLAVHLWVQAGVLPDQAVHPHIARALS